MAKPIKPDSTREDRPKGPGKLRKAQPVGARDAQVDPDASPVSEPEAPSAEQELREGVNIYTNDDNLRPLAEIEADIIRIAIGHYRGSMSEVARRLGIGRSTLYRKLSELDIDSSS